MKFTHSALIVIAVAILSMGAIMFAQKQWGQPAAPVGVIIQPQRPELVEPASGIPAKPAAPAALAAPAEVAVVPEPETAAETPPPTTATDNPPVQELGTTRTAPPTATQGQENKKEPYVSYVYERPTFQKFSQMYWTLGKLDLNVDYLVDNFLMINECEIFMEYFHNEFEWKTVRDSARKFISENKSKFPLRYEIIQPLILGEYDIENERFDILPEYKISNTRRFEIHAYDAEGFRCNQGKSVDLREIPGYPRGLLVELTRPIMLTSLPLDKLTAHNFVEERMKKFKMLRPEHQNRQNLYAFRDVYIVMKIKLFAYRKETWGMSGNRLAEVLGILEGIEVYADRRKKKLLYVEDYRRRKQGIKTNANLNMETLHTPILSDDPPELRKPVKLMQQGKYD